MIVQPHFFHHFKTRKLIELTGNDAAPLWVLKLWGYCQTQRTSRFENLSDATLANICDCNHPQVPIRQLLLDCGFVVEDGNAIIVHDWDKTNAQLLASWRNGKRGGWPGEKRSHGQPTDYPRASHETEEKDPEAFKKLAQLCGELGSKLRAGEKLDGTKC